MKVPTEVLDGKLASLPEGVSVSRDRIEVRFGSAKEAVGRLYSLALVTALRTQAETTPEARKCIHYVFGNRHRMRYPQFRAKGLCIASGVVEAGCKQIGARLKRAGMRWTVAGANAILALRCCILSGPLRGLLGATSRKRRLRLISQ